MEKIKLIIDGALREVNDELKNGWKIKFISAVADSVSVAVPSNGCSREKSGKIYAYVVLEKDE